jgi:hypothetical protein
MFRMMHITAAAVAALGLLGFTSMARAGDDDCSSGHCRKRHCDQCESTTETKKVAKRVYDDECKDLCVPACSLKGHCLFHGWKCEKHNDCAADCPEECKEGRCKKLHCKQKFLIIKIRYHDECVHKCTANECCATSCEGAPAAPAGAKPESIPPPKPGDDDADINHSGPETLTLPMPQ